VEIGYSVCPEWRGRGYATEVVRALAAYATRIATVQQVLAHTFAANPASVAVLTRSGFVAAGAGAEPSTLRFEYTTSAAGG
jgi:RimJ/RimL family protein N-acetyltransferase